MKKSKIFYFKLLLVICLSLFFVDNVDAQKRKKATFIKTYDFATGKIYAIKLIDDSSFAGKFIEKNGTNLVFESTLGLRYGVDEKDIRSINIVDPINIVKGKYWFPNPHATRYLFGPSAYNLKSGEGYYQNIYGTVNSINYGITDHFTLGVGTELITLFSSFPLIIVTPKLGGYKVNDSWHVGGGAIVVATSDGSGGIGYGIATYGDENSNVSFGLGWAGANVDDIQTLPIATISGMRRFSKNIAFISENWVIPANPYIPIFSYGIRFFGEQMSVDIALVNNYSIATEVLPIGLPFVDFVYKF